MVYAYHMAIRTTMNVSLTPELERFVQQLVKSGRYNSASEVFRAGLRLLERAEWQRVLEKSMLEGLTADEEAKVPAELLEQARASLRTKIQAGLDQARRGELIDGEEFMAEWRARLDAAIASEAAESDVKRRA